MANNSGTKSTNAITESVLAVNQLVLGSAASSAMAGMYVSMSHAAGLSAQNAVSEQQHLNILGAAAVAAGTGNLLWEGVSRQVGNLTVDDRLKYWQKMMAITSGQAAPGEELKEEGGKSEAKATGEPAEAEQVEGQS